MIIQNHKMGIETDKINKFPAATQTAKKEMGINLPAEINSEILKTLAGIKLSFKREDLEMLFKENYSQQNLIEIFKRDFSSEFNIKLGKGFGEFTLTDHIIRVLQQYDRFLSSDELPMKMDKNFFRVILTLHDIGKSAAIKEGDTSLQHQYTPAKVKAILEELRYTEEQIKAAILLTGNDPIGMLFKNRDVKKGAANAFSKLKELSKQLESSLEETYRLFLIMYLADASSYTRQAGFPRMLDEIFNFDLKENILEFSDSAQKKIDELEELIFV